MARFDNFADLAEHYASLTSADAFAGAFTSEITASQLSIHDEPTADDLPDADAARIVAAPVTGEIFNLFADTRLAAIAPRIAWGIVNKSGRASCGGGECQNGYSWVVDVTLKKNNK